MASGYIMLYIWKEFPDSFAYQYVAKQMAETNEIICTKAEINHSPSHEATTCAQPLQTSSPLSIEHCDQPNMIYGFPGDMTDLIHCQDSQLQSMCNKWEGDNATLQNTTVMISPHWQRYKPQYILCFCTIVWVQNMCMDNFSFHIS